MKQKTICPHCEAYCNADLEVYGVEFHLIENGYRPHQEIEITRAWDEHGNVITDKKRIEQLEYSLMVDVNSGDLTI